MDKLGVSIIIPCYNELDNIDRLYSELKETVKRLDCPAELIFVDDGSTDGTREKLQGLAATDKNTKLILLSRNYGQTTALAAGLDFSKGELIITMDGDLQNDPRDIGLLLEEIKKGTDVVSGWRKQRKDKFFTRILPSNIANFLISFLTGVKLHDYGCALKVYKKEFLANLSIYGEMHRFLPAYCVWQGAKVSEIVVHHRPRIYGKSKYGLGRIFKVLLDLFVVKFFLSYLTKPIYIFGGAAVLAFLFGLVVNIVVIIRKVSFAGQWLSPLFFIGFSFWGLSVVCMLLGLLSEILVRLYFESRQTPSYRISKKVNL